MTSDGLSSPQYLRNQYRDSSNLDIRVSIHDRFSVNHYGWSKWVFDQIRLEPQSEILELGCGTGGLWRLNLERLPASVHITLSDFSEGMLQQARDSLALDSRFEFKVVDAQVNPLPFGDALFDVVVANHMLYHIAERQSLLSEIARVLKPNGRLYASTVGRKHLVEIAEMLVEFDRTLSSWGIATDSFTLENGPSQLSSRFTNTRLSRYEDALAVTQLEPLIDCIRSGWFELESGRLESFKQFMAAKFRSANGVLHVSKDSGIFQGYSQALIVLML
jgi:ubiquinone/menaquinone biosynthesis C-methylase UbiE